MEMDENRAYYYGDETCEMNLDNTLAGTILFTTSLFGFILNAMAAYYLLWLPNLRNAFGILMSSHAISSAGVLATIAFFYAPIVFFVACEFSVSSVGFVIASSINFYWYATVFGQIAIALNRCLAISSPVKYRRYFTNANAVVIAIVPWLLGLLMMLWYAFGCAMYIDPITMTSNLPLNECNQISWKYGIYLDNSFVVLLLVIDAYTMFRLRAFAKRLNSNLTADAAQTAEKRRQRQEIRFFMQAFSIDVFLVVNQLYNAFVPSFLADVSKWTYFIFAAMPYIVQHFIDAVIIFCINPEIRNRICGRRNQIAANENTRFVPRSITVVNPALPIRSMQLTAGPMAMAPVQARIYHG